MKQIPKKYRSLRDVYSTGKKYINNPKEQRKILPLSESYDKVLASEMGLIGNLSKAKQQLWDDPIAQRKQASAQYYQDNPRAAGARNAAMAVGKKLGSKFASAYTGGLSNLVVDPDGNIGSAQTELGRIKQVADAGTMVPQIINVILKGVIDGDDHYVWESDVAGRSKNVDGTAGPGRSDGNARYNIDPPAFLFLRNWLSTKRASIPLQAQGHPTFGYPVDYTIRFVQQNAKSPDMSLAAVLQSLSKLDKQPWTKVQAVQNSEEWRQANAAGDAAAMSAAEANFTALLGAGNISLIEGKKYPEAIEALLGSSTYAAADNGLNRAGAGMPDVEGLKQIANGYSRNYVILTYKVPDASSTGLERMLIRLVDNPTFPAWTIVAGGSDDANFKEIETAIRSTPGAPYGKGTNGVVGLTVRGSTQRFTYSYIENDQIDLSLA